MNIDSHDPSLPPGASATTGRPADEQNRRKPRSTLLHLPRLINSIITIPPLRHAVSLFYPRLLFARMHTQSMSISSTVTALPVLQPSSHVTPPPHHIGSPPTSFTNPWPSFKHVSPLAGFRASRNIAKNAVPIPENREGLVVVRKPDWGHGQNGLKATWIGHASFLIETTALPGSERGLRIMLDPVWSNRMGPFGMVGPVRFTPPPCPVDQVPEVDAVCISHDHYDHLDVDTLKKLNAKQNGNLRFFCGLGVKATLMGLGANIKAEQVTEMDWWDGVELAKEGVGSAQLVCTPAQHQSGRTPWGFWSTLWCSWIIKESSTVATPSTTASTAPLPTTATPQPQLPQQGKRLYFAGDTGYNHSDSLSSSPSASAGPACPAFAEIGALHGPFDLALLPIGCFLPRPLLSSQHSSPEDSMCIHKDVRARKSIGMHYGTIRGQLSKGWEPVDEPVKKWREAVDRAEGVVWWDRDGGLGKASVDAIPDGQTLAGLCDVGETVVV